MYVLTLYLPVSLLAGFSPQVRRMQDEVLRHGIGVLMWIQPWFAGKIEIRMPDCVGQGVLLISNHRSHLDVFILLSRVCGIRILAKSTLFKIPVLAYMMRSSRQIGVARGQLAAWVLAMEEVKIRLANGERVHVFPEMTRCAPGFQGMHAFTLGPFLAAIQQNAVVLPIVIRDTDRTWPKGFYGLFFRRPIHVRSLAPLRAQEFTSAEQLKVAVQQQIEQALI